MVPYLQQRQQHIAPTVAGIPYQIYLFGSRANHIAHAGSDIDLAILAEQDLRLPLSQARFALENSTIPYKIDLVELRRTSPDFQQHVLREGQLLWKVSVQVTGTSYSSNSLLAGTSKVPVTSRC